MSCHNSTEVTTDFQKVLRYFSLFYEKHMRARSPLRNSSPAMFAVHSDSPATDLFEGRDKTPGVVAVEPSMPGRMLLYRRAEDGSTFTEERPFRPWILAQSPDRWRSSATTTAVTQLDGEHAFRYLVELSHWGALLDEQAAARQRGEHLLAISSPVEQFLIISGITLFKRMVFTDLRRLQLDIETLGLDASQPNQEIIMVALRLSDGREELLVNEGDEGELLDRLTDYIRSVDPDVIEGHNLYNFDLPYLSTRARRCKRSLDWGRDGSMLRLRERTQRYRVGPLSPSFRPAFIHGRHIIDTLQQIQRYDVAGKLTSYGLKSVIDALGWTRPDRTFVPGERIAEMWRTAPDQLALYAMDDVRDVELIASLTTPTEFYQTQLLPRSFQQSALDGTGTKIDDLMVRAYLAQGHSIPAPQTPRPYPGGFTELIRAGVFSPVVKCDVESLYPSIMLSLGLAPQSDVLGAFIPMLRDLTQLRLRAKSMSRHTTGTEQAVWNGLQASYKVLINSFYGYLGFGGGAFNDFDAAERVTLEGQRIIRAAVARLSELGALPIEVDTDGVYFVPPRGVETEDDEIALIERIGAGLPAGIRLAHDGRFQSMLALGMKTYGLLEYDGSLVLKGSALRSRRVERCFRDFLAASAVAFMRGNTDTVRETYFELAERIRARELPIDDISQWAMVRAETIAKQPRLKRLLDRVPADLSGSDRLRIYERQDGELALVPEYAHDENVSYLLRRLQDTALRFRPLFKSEHEVQTFFPLITPKTDLDQAKTQESSTQLSMFPV